MKKRILSVFLALIIALSVVSVGTLAVSAKKVDLAETGSISARSGDFYYEVTLDNTAVLTGYYGTATSVTLPSKIAGYTVREIGSYLFSSRTNVVKVVIPSTVTTIHGNAFRDCTKLSTISIPSSVYSIGYTAFTDTAWYKKQANGIIYAGSVAIGYKGTCPSTLTFKSGTKGIGYEAFRSNKNLTTVNFPSSLIEISYGAFGGCSNLTYINGVSNVKYVADYAFGSTQWYYNQPDGVMYIGKALYKYKGNKNETPSTINVKAGTVSITANALENCDYLQKVVFPTSLTHIGSYAFAYCDLLSSINLPSSLCVMENYAFCNCPALTKITVPVKVRYIANGTFKACTGLSSVTLPSALVAIGYGAFKDCSKLTSIKLNNSLQYIDDDAFLNTGIKTIVVPKTVKKIVLNALGYKIVNSKYTKVSGFTIKGYFGTAAAEYAKKNGFKFVSVSGFKLDTPIIKSLAKTSAGVKVTIGKISGAVKYRVFRKQSGTSWKKVGDTTSTVFTDKTVRSGVQYAYTARCISSNGKSLLSDYDKTGKSIYYLKTVSSPALPTLKNTKSGVQVSWKAVKYAAKYRVFRKTGSGSWTKIADTTKTSYVDKKAKSGVTYRYTIRCISLDGKRYTSNFNKTGKAIKCKR